MTELIVSIENPTLMAETENRDTIVCDNIDEYLKAVGYGIQD